jgi:hypothetical protein
MFAAVAALIVALLIYRQIVIAMVNAGGIPIALALIAASYALACRLHRRGGY